MHWGSMQGHLTPDLAGNDSLMPLPLRMPHTLSARRSLSRRSLNPSDSDKAMSMQPKHYQSSPDARHDQVLMPSSTVWSAHIS